MREPAPSTRRPGRHAGHHHAPRHRRRRLKRLLGAGEAKAAGVDPNATSVLDVDGPDGRTCTVVIRPALPDEIAAA